MENFIKIKVGQVVELPNCIVMVLNKFAYAMPTELPNVLPHIH